MRTDVWQTLHSDLRPGVQPDGETFAATLGARTILLPIRSLGDGEKGLASLIVNQASFAVFDALADALAASLSDLRPDLIVGVPTLGLTLADAVARRLGHARIVPLGTSRKFWYDDDLSVPLVSITSPGMGKRLYLDPRMQPLLAGRIVVVDDVLSSGRTIAAACALLARVDVVPVGVGCAMLQGEAWHGALDVPAIGAIRSPILRRKGDGWAES